MSLRKFMHPRNKYKKVPDFKKLALLYPEFRKIAITDLVGKIKIDYKNEESLRTLTEVLLKHDFNLNVKIPVNKLVPTLPLRLNYVLWIEDLMKHATFNEMDTLKGIDIGTGAVCIYPLLFAKMYGTRMIGTEVDESSIKTAIQHVENNGFQHLITVHKVGEGTILKDIVKENNIHQFTMCNPPFFETEEIEKPEKRMPPRNAPTGNEMELTVEGGERAFVTRMIEESMEIKDRVQIYTTMFGRRCNLLFLLKYLKKRNIDNMTWTEFCQGYTKRWGLAWTFLSKDILDLTNAPVIRKSGVYVEKLLKEKKPIDIKFPMQQRFSSLENIVNFLEDVMQELNIQMKELNLPIDDFNGWSCQLIAKNNTWSHARRKRRLAQRLISKSNENYPQDTIEKSESIEESAGNENKESPENVNKDLESVNPVDESIANEPLLILNIFVEVVEQEEYEEDDIKISMVYEKGNGGRDSMETLRQYLINKLGIREYFQKQTSKVSKGKRKRLKTCESERNSEQNVHLLNTKAESV